MSNAVDAIFDTIEVIPFYENTILETSYQLYDTVNDYIDSVILATAVMRKESLATEDQIILSLKKEIKDRYGIDVFSYRDLVD
ncbi:MAG: hypothetical protein F7B60_03110 [Desulfurococcales archaeon]|nr:hypothetical protein [Desulfurococcales archaeon]